MTELQVQSEMTGGIPDMLALMSGSYFDLVSGKIVLYSDYTSQIPLYPDGLYPGLMWNPGELGYSGYHFMGFASYPNAPEPLFMLSGDISDSALYPVWYPESDDRPIPSRSDNVRTHKVTFAVSSSVSHKFSGDLPPALTLKYGSELDIAGYWDDKMTASGLHFVGWSTNPNFPTIIPRIVVSRDITLYAVWYAAKVPYHKPRTFSVRFGNGSEIHVNQHSTLRLRGFNPDNVRYAGYSLDGWSNHPNSDKSLFHLLVREDTFLYPVWVKEPNHEYYEEPVLPEPPIIEPPNEKEEEQQELDWYHPDSTKHPYHKDNPYSVFAENNPYDTAHPGYPYGDNYPLNIDWSLFPDDASDIYHPYTSANPYNPQNTHHIVLTGGAVVNPDNVYVYTSFQYMNGVLRSPLYKGTVELRQQFLDRVPDIYSGDFKGKHTFCEEPRVSEGETITLTVDNSDGFFIIPTGGLSSSGASCVFDWDIWVDYEYAGRWTGNSGLRSQGIVLDLYDRSGIAAVSVTATPDYEMVNRDTEFDIPVEVVSDGQWKCVPFWIRTSDSGILRGKGLGIYRDFLEVTGFRELYSGTTRFTVKRQPDERLGDRLLQGFVFYPTRMVENCGVEIVLLDFNHPDKLRGPVCIYGPPVFDPVELGVRRNPYNYETDCTPHYRLGLICGKEEPIDTGSVVRSVRQRRAELVCEYEKPRFKCGGPRYDVSVSLFPLSTDSVLNEHARCILNDIFEEISEEVVEPTAVERYEPVALGSLYGLQMEDNARECMFEFRLSTDCVEHINRSGSSFISKLVSCLPYSPELGKSKITIRPHYRAAFSYGWLRAFGFAYNSVERWNLQHNKDKLLEVETAVTPTMFCDSGTDAGNYCMRYLFYGCRNMKLGNRFNFTDAWNQVTRAGNAFMFRAFQNCKSLDRFPLNYREPQGFITVGEDFKAYKCCGCENLRSLGVENTDISGLTSASYGYGRFEYYGCKSLLKLPDCYTEPKQINGADLYDFQFAKFMGCSTLQYLPYRYRETAITSAGNNYLAYKFSETGLTHLPAGYKYTQGHRVGNNCHVGKFAGCASLRCLPRTYDEIKPTINGTNFLKWKFRDSLLGDITYDPLSVGGLQNVLHVAYESQSNFMLAVEPVKRQTL